MADEKVYTPTIEEDKPFPQETTTTQYSSGGESGDTYTPKEIKENVFPGKKIAFELMAQALNTKSKKILQEFQFAQQGSIQVGSYVDGTSGDIRISPNGITARDTAGETTFNLDGLTGDATFKGTIQAGAVVAGDVVVGNNTWVISGDDTNPRIILYNSSIPSIVIGSI